MTSREQFEAWVKSETGFDLRRTNYPMTAPENQQYAEYSTNLAWMAWQASREAVELDIEWPEANDDTWKDGEEGAYAMGHEDGKDKVVIAVRKAIRAAGIKVKGE